MQNDLISRSALIEAFSKNSIFTKVTNAEGKNVLEIINDQPIAYDVEKVVAELEEEVDYQDKKSYEADTFEEVSVSSTRISMRKCYEHAIEIVRNGGKE